jgi:hypothetical protein
MESECVVMCSSSDISFNATFSMRNNVFYLVTLFHIFQNFVLILYTYRALKIPYSSQAA